MVLDTMKRISYFGLKIKRGNQQDRLCSSLLCTLNKLTMAAAVQLPKTGVELVDAEEPDAIPPAVSGSIPRIEDADSPFRFFALILF